MNLKCEICGEQIEGDFDEMDAPDLCEECQFDYEKNKEIDRQVDERRV